MCANRTILLLTALVIPFGLACVSALGDYFLCDLTSSQTCAGSSPPVVEE